ncbi:alkaline phosphatase [Elizabethkingia meningoseptica]|uniref:alkaline phosphatase n=1 Tax=Elizabethkingia meningoseptica TaxID=238 RepID=UPI000332CE98|nr:alkaline phosphatase [Elizabethkingia meningoseptica]AQX05650.1 alkaline phosphatase [Elizabethkingia meningoseptica]AQX47693.1 alkaline phosphatase [Elizabethkingia meningoseptica]EOR30685.1 alkaline phosphatase [Elizabethkingia meningoseptica ATCC 13253 = NBRC 12535]KUY24044.1 alkaline phosphatase [Elizabethkingia meningoseptica]OPB67758.1 alkaline phosphatase [Elizabethkingia meningoseptica]
MRLSKKIWAILALAVFSKNQAQNYLNYNVSNAHSHNDYMQEIPFWQAYYANFGSIEADVFLVKGQLWVAHTEKELSPERTLESLYLNNISKQIKLNKGHVYPDANKKLQLLIDVKQDYKSTLETLVNTLKKYPEITGNAGVKIVITGGRPQPQDFKNYPDYLFFDGDLDKTYTPDQLKRIGLFSADLQELVKWNGKGIPRDEETEKVKNAVEKAHRMQKPMRFYGAPDFPNAWVNLMDMGADYINTDHIPDLKKFMNNIPKNFYKSTKEYSVYKPTYETDRVNKKVKNVILLIPDGTSLPQYYAAFTANKGKLNVFNMKATGHSKTNSSNAYITDSAPGSTAFATGVKTKNTFVGVDSEGKALVQIPDIIAAKGMSSGLISTGDVTDATPADFYAHSDNRNSSEPILKDFVSSKTKILIGGPTSGLSEDNLQKIKTAKIDLYRDLKSVNKINNRTLIIDPLASQRITNGRGNWLADAFDLTLNDLKNNKNGFFMMVEASQTDGGGHSNNLEQLVTELLDFDHVVGKAMKFADDNKETLVVVLGDHETGGLTLLDGSLKEGWVFGNFSTNDHTSIPSSVFAYGPNSKEFTGLFENTEIFNKILAAYGIRK